MADEIPSMYGNLHPALRPRARENDRAYAAFLLYCMQVPADRSIRLTAKSLGVAESTARYWRRSFAWTRRAQQVPDLEWEALRAYRQLMDLQDGAGQVAAFIVAMDVVLDRAGYAEVRAAVKAQRQGKEAGPPEHAVPPMSKPGTPPAAAEPPKRSKKASKKADKPADESLKPGGAAGQHEPTRAFTTPLSDAEMEVFDPQAYMRRLRSQVQQRFLTVDQVGRQVMLIDGILGLFAKQVQEGKLQLHVRDLPQLLKVRALLTGMPTEASTVAVAVQHQHTHDVVVESARITEARRQGGTALVAAMQEEVSELQVILQAMPKQVIDVTPENS